MPFPQIPEMSLGGGAGALPQTPSSPRGGLMGASGPYVPSYRPKVRGINVLTGEPVDLLEDEFEWARAMGAVVTPEEWAQGYGGHSLSEQQSPQGSRMQQQQALPPAPSLPQRMPVSRGVASAGGM